MLQREAPTPQLSGTAITFFECRSTIGPLISIEFSRLRGCFTTNLISIPLRTLSLLLLLYIYSLKTITHNYFNISRSISIPYFLSELNDEPTYSKSFVRRLRFLGCACQFIVFRVSRRGNPFTIPTRERLSLALILLTTLFIIASRELPPLRQNEL